MNRSKQGGIKIKDSYEGSKDAAIDDFLKNSNIEYFNKGNFGIILRAKTKNGYDSPYESLRFNTLNQSVRVLLIKILLIKDEEDSDVSTSPPVLFDSNFDTITPEEFQREVDIQREIFETTNEKGDAICPSIVYDNDDYDVDLLKTSIENKKLIQQLKPLFNLFDGEIGLIAMEILPNYLNIYSGNTNYLSQLDSKLANYYKKLKKINKNDVEIKEEYKSYQLLDSNVFNIDNPDKIYQGFALIISELIRCYKIGYIHGDFHLNNILFNKDEKYVPSFKGKALLIDFGYSFPVPNDKRDLSDNKEIINVLLTTINPFYEFAPESFVSYQWLNYIANNETFGDEVFKYLNIIEQEREKMGGKKKKRTLKKYKKMKNKTKRAPFYLFPFLARK